MEEGLQHAAKKTTSGRANYFLMANLVAERGGGGARDRWLLHTLQLMNV